MNGIWRSANYAFAPNYLKYCGPDKNRELAGYLTQSVVDAGLKSMLEKFEAMHPYLKLIAQENGLGDEFDERVVEAYWLGNNLLDQVSPAGFYRHVKPRLPLKDLKWFEAKLPAGAKPNHQFHVLNFIIRTGHRQVKHTVETMDNCRISWGKVLPGGKVKTNRLIYQNGKLSLTPGVKEVKNLVKDFKAGDLVTLHWGWICEKINRQQAENLQKYTNLALRLANQTL
jgi:hydrogenase maturation factor